MALKYTRMCCLDTLPCYLCPAFVYVREICSCCLLRGMSAWSCRANLKAAVGGAGVAAGAGGAGARAWAGARAGAGAGAT